jgi:hypothetical protein
MPSKSGGGSPTRRRPRFGETWPEPIKGDVPYAKSRPELAGLSVGEQVDIVMKTPAWNEVMRPILDALDKDRPKKGPKPSYSSEELESCLLYQLLAGVSTYAEARALLAGDRGERDRVLLGFDKPRDRVGRGLRLVTSKEGVPSEATVWRHLQRFGLSEHARASWELFERVAKEHFEEFPEQMSEEARLVHWDGSVLLTHYTSYERKNRVTGVVKPPTLTGGGYRPRTMGNAGKDGHGFNLVCAVTQTGLPLGARLTPINVPEAKTARGILEDEWQRMVAPYLQDDLVRVMACDAAYSGGHFREAMHRAGFVPNCHPVSHADRERSVKNAERKQKAKLKIGYGRDQMWHLNGHHELSCKCGQGKTFRRANKNKKGEAIARLEGTCPNCGFISLTAGEWRLYSNGKAVAKAASDEKDKLDWRIGNPLTFNDPLSAKYGSCRFGQNEGMHGALVTRFGLLKDKAWYRDRRQAERDLLLVFCAMHALAKEQRRRAAMAVPTAPLTGEGSGAPPPLARAA